MAKKMTSFRLDPDSIELLKLVAETENRSQADQLEYLIKKESVRLKIKPTDKK